MILVKNSVIRINNRVSSLLSVLPNASLCRLSPTQSSLRNLPNRSVSKMPPKGTKRKSPSSASPSSPSNKSAKKETNAAPSYNHSRATEEVGIVQRELYPQEISNERCAQYANNEIPRPMDILEKTIKDTAERREKIEVGEAVIYWFKRDLRLQDNKGLHLASQKAKSKGVPLICLFIISPQDYQAHLTSAARVDYELRSLEIMKEDLGNLNIPLVVRTIEKRKTIPSKMLEFCEEWGARHIFCNIEYEVDELRREELLTRECLEKGISFNAIHDDVVVTPGALETGSGNQYSIYSPFYRAWMTNIHSNPSKLDLFPAPSENPSTTRSKFSDIFNTPIPSAPSNKTLGAEEKERFSNMWPAGEHEAQSRLEKFLRERIGKYKDTRNLPAANSTSMISVHLSSGSLSARTAVRKARDANTTKNLGSGSKGIISWISEIAWRDFYKHVLVRWPYVCMNKSFKYEYSDIEWEYNPEHFQKWCEGMTGFPIVDAAMRQPNYMGYMHNRCRMIVASFLTKDLLLDWRMGEKYFMEHLIDGDFASNNGGWGFSASTGVDPQPYFRIFNPLLQSEKFDEKGEYIRKWVPELADVVGKAVHDPYGRGAAKEAERKAYPKPIVDHSECRQRALDRFKNGLKRDTA